MKKAKKPKAGKKLRTIESQWDNYYKEVRDGHKARKAKAKTRKQDLSRKKILG